VASTQFHEPAEKLRAETREMHRALVSLIEELEAVDWYAQRVDASDDAELTAVLAHNRDEEKEHACMVLEWIRRRDAKFDEMLRRYLFRSGEIEDEATDASASRDAESAPDFGTLRIGSLRGTEAEAT
jgi:ferritin-like protein